MFHEFNIQVANKEHYCCVISRETVENISLQILLFPEGGKTILSGRIFQDRGLEATKILQISDVKKVSSRFNNAIYKSGLESDMDIQCN